MNGVLDRYLEKRPHWQLFILGLLIVGLLALFDYVTGYEVSFSIFYLIPISLVGWYTHLGFAVVVTLLSAVTWLYVDLLAGHTYSSAWIPLWNTAVRLGFYAPSAC